MSSSALSKPLKLILLFVLRTAMYSAAVSDHLGSPLEVVEERADDLWRGVHLGNGGSHVLEPPITLRGPDREREVPHAESRVPPLRAVGGWPSPVLRQE